MHKTRHDKKIKKREKKGMAGGIDDIKLFPTGKMSGEADVIISSADSKCR